MADLPLIRRMEAVGFRAWPAASVHYDGSWAVRLTASHASRRLNSVNPLDPADHTDIEARVRRSRKRFQAYDRTLTFRLTPLSPPPLTQYFDAQGWSRAGQTAVMRLPLDEAALEGGFDLVPLKDLNRFVDAAIQVSSQDPDRKSGLAEVIESIRPPHGLFVLEDANGPVASALCVHDNDLAGLFEVAVRSDSAGRGYGRAIVRAALRWAASQGAQHGWLQVETANKPAVGLYERLGFETLYTYEYREQDEATA